VVRDFDWRLRVRALTISRLSLNPFARESVQSWLGAQSDEQAGHDPTSLEFDNVAGAACHDTKINFQVVDWVAENIELKARMSTCTGLLQILSKEKGRAWVRRVLGTPSERAVGLVLDAVSTLHQNDAFKTDMLR
jgi:hypothetical protein